MPKWLETTWTHLLPYLPAIGAALAILIGGWIGALIVRSMVYAALKRTTLDQRIAEGLGFETDEASSDKIEKVVSQTFYYIALALVFVAFLERLHVTAVTEPIVGALGGVLSAVPNLMKAALIGGIGYVLATAARKLLRAALLKTKLVSRIERLSGEKDAKALKKRSVATADLLSSIVFYIVLGVAAIPVLETLKIGALSAPLSATFAAVSTYLPKVVGAAVLALLGYVLGRLARAVITRLFAGLGVDKGVSRLGLTRFLGGQTVGSIVGSLAMAFIILNFAISAVGRLDITELSGPLSIMLQQIYDYLPKLLVGGLLMTVGVMLARFASRLASNLLSAVGFNTLMGHIGVYTESAADKAQREKSRKLIEQRLEKSKGEDSEDEEDDGEVETDELLAGNQGLETPADVGGVVVGVFVVLLFLKQVLGTLQLAGLASLLDSLIGYLPHVFSAAVVLGAAMWAGSWAHKRIDDLTKASKDGLFRSLGSVAHVVVVSVGAMVALQQLGVGKELITTAFALLLGSICLALALAFGLGGKDVAGRILNKEYEKHTKR